MSKINHKERLEEAVFNIFIGCITQEEVKEEMREIISKIKVEALRAHKRLADYCFIDCAYRIPFDKMFLYSKSIKLNRDIRVGDVIDGYIIPTKEFGVDKHYKDEWVKGVSLSAIEIISSNRADLELHGFEKDVTLCKRDTPIEFMYLRNSFIF